MIKTLRTENGGNPLFEFQFSLISSQQGMRRVQKTVFHAQLQQHRETRSSDNLGVHLTEALYKAIKDQITSDARQSNQEQTKRRRRWGKR